MKYYLGIDIGGTNTKIGVINSKSELIFSNIFRTKSSIGFKEAIKRISIKIKDFLKQKNVNLEDIISIGVGVPGPVKDKSVVITFSNFSWEKNLNLKEEFEKHFNKPVYVDNDVNVIVLGEYWKGVAKGYNNVLMLAIGTGIGGGLIINNKLISGKNGNAAEIGHIKLTTNENAKLCGCGQKGCFESFASATGLIREAVSRLMVSNNTKLLKKYKNTWDDLEAHHIFSLAKEGDKLCQELVEYEAYYLAHGISISVNLLDPDLVVIGGGISKAGDYLLDKVKGYMKNWTMLNILENLEIKQSILGDDAGIYGAVYLAMSTEKGE